MKVLWVVSMLIASGCATKVGAASGPSNGNGSGDALGGGDAASDGDATASPEVTTDVSEVSDSQLIQQPKLLDNCDPTQTKSLCLQDQVSIATCGLTEGAYRLVFQEKCPVSGGCYMNAIAPLSIAACGCDPATGGGCPSETPACVESQVAGSVVRNCVCDASPSATVAGLLHGSTIHAKAASFFPPQAGLPGYLVVSDSAEECAAAEKGASKANSMNLVFDFMSWPPKVGENPTKQISFVHYGASCVISEDSQLNGTLTISKYGGCSLIGTFDVTSNGDHATGQFTAIVCGTPPFGTSTPCL